MWYAGSYILRKYYMVFDATPQLSADGQQGYLQVGFAQAYHESSGGDDDDGNDINPSDPSESLLDKLLPVIYAVIIIVIVVVLCIVWFTYYRMKQRAKIAKMSHSELTENAEIIM